MSEHQLTEKEQEMRFIVHLDYILKGDINAIRFCHAFVAVIHVWDDLYDGDKVVDKKTMNEMFRVILVDIPKNSFYKKHIDVLTTMIQSVILQWYDANVVEEQNEKKIEHLRQTYMLRAGVMNLISYCAFLVGGIDWYNQISLYMRDMYKEDFVSYVEEICGGVKCQTL